MNSSGIKVKNVTKCEEECGNCAVKSSDLKRCSYCLLVYYCSRECQKQDWKAGGHKYLCFKPGSVGVLRLKKPANIPEITFECPICLLDLRENMNVEYACSHMFHYECYMTMRMKDAAEFCPTCRCEVGRVKSYGWMMDTSSRTLHVITSPLAMEPIFGPWNPGPILNHKESCECGKCMEKSIYYSFSMRTGWPLGTHTLLDEKEKRQVERLKCILKSEGNSGDAASLCSLARLYEGNELTKKDFPRSRYWFKKAADAGDAIAQYRVGDMYNSRTNSSPQPNYKECVRYYRLASDQGVADATHNLGCLYLGQHEGFTYVNIEEGIRLIIKAADQGLSKSMCLMGVWLYQGHKLPRSLREAALMFTFAAYKGEKQAMYLISGCYLRGHGVKQNYNKALAWCEKGDAVDDEEKYIGYLKVWANAMFESAEIF